jgi:hypothetical protein
MNHGRTTGTTLALLLGLASPALAQGEEQGVEGKVQEFFLGEEAPPNQKQQVEAGTGLEWEQQDGEANFKLPVHVEYGLSDRIQLQGEAEMTPEGEDPGLDGGRVGARWALVNDGERSLAVSAGAEVLATRDAPGTSLRPGVSPFLLAYKDFGRVGVNASAGAELLPASGDRDGTVRPDLGMAVVLDAGAVRPMFEAAFRNEQGTNTGILSPGFLIEPTKSLQVGLSAPIRLGDDGQNSVGVGAMLTWNGGGGS